MTKKKSYFGGALAGIKTLLTGMDITMGEYATRKITEQYPENRKTQHIAERHRGTLIMPHDENGNAVVGENVHLYDCKGCIVHAPNASSVVLEGMEDSIVVERGGRILVCRLSEEQRIKDFTK